MDLKENKNDLEIDDVSKTQTNFRSLYGLTPEVENAIYDHPDVLEASVFGIPDERLGEILCSAIFLRDGSDLDKDSLTEFLSNKLAAFKIPVVVKFLDSNLPLVASGKFDKPALRKMFMES